MTNIYKNIIFTTHALHRLKGRSLGQRDIFLTVNYPEIKNPTKKINTYKFIRAVRKRKVQVIANWREEERKWLVISVWVRGEEDKKPLAWRVITAPFRAIIWFFKK